MVEGDPADQGAERHAWPGRQPRASPEVVARPLMGDGAAGPILNLATVALLRGALVFKLELLLIRSHPVSVRTAIWMTHAASGSSLISGWPAVRMPSNNAANFSSARRSWPRNP